MEAAQNVSIGITINGVKIDLVPGRLQEGYKDYHSLWRRRASTRMQTNVSLHIDKVRDSGRVGEIRVLKIWRRNHGLSFPSFYLELTVLDALSGCGEDLPSNVSTILKYLRDDFVLATTEDPSNSNNTISDDLTLAEKKAIAKQAGISHAQTTWGKTLW